MSAELDQIAAQFEGVDGPAIIEERGATTVIPPGWMVKVDSYGNLLLNRGN